MTVTPRRHRDECDQLGGAPTGAGRVSNLRFYPLCTLRAKRPQPFNSLPAVAEPEWIIGVCVPGWDKGDAMHALRTSVCAQAARGNICQQLNTNGHNPTRNT